MDVYTNVDQDVQKRLWDIYNTDEYVYYPDDELQAASTIIDVTNGKVIAQLGSRHQSSNVPSDSIRPLKPTVTGVLL